MTLKRSVAALSLMLLASVGIACAGGEDAESFGRTQNVADVRAKDADYASEEMAQSDTGGGSGGGSTATSASSTTGTNDGGGDLLEPSKRAAGLPEIGLSVIKTATVSIEVGEDHVQDAIQDATSTADKYGGFVVSTTVAEGNEDPNGAIVIRIPASRFGSALADLEGLGEVSSENVSGEDVSQEFIDLEARLRNYVAQETVMLKLMERAQTVVDTIRVQNELQRVQLEIERLRGRLQYLEDQTAMSTIELRVAEEGAIAEPPGEFEKAWERAKDGLIGVVAGLISSLGVVVPLALLALLVIYVIARLRPRFTGAR